MNYINQDTFRFFSELESNNNREWFQKNKSRYDTVRKSFIGFLHSIHPGLISIDRSMEDLDIPGSVFRIYRDIRFSSDKRPYKTNIGALLVRGGRKNMSQAAGYYIHIENNNSFISGGAYMPESSWLKNIRKEIDINPDEFRAVINNRKFREYFGSLQGEKLKKAPQGYSTGHPDIELLKHKNFLAMHETGNETVLSGELGNHFLEAAEAMKPLNDFLNYCKP